MVVHLIAGLIKKIWCDSIGCNYIKMSQFFPKPYKQFSRGIRVKVDHSNNATKGDIKNISHVDTSSFALKANLASLKTEVDILDINKLVPVPVDLSKLSDVVKNDVVKKDVYDKLIAKVNNIDTSDFVLNTKYDTDKSELDNKIPDISNLATKTALTTTEKKIPDVSNLITKTDFGSKLSNLNRKVTTNKTKHLPF